MAEMPPALRRAELLGAVHRAWPRVRERWDDVHAAPATAPPG